MNCRQTTASAVCGWSQAPPTNGRASVLQAGTAATPRDSTWRALRSVGVRCVQSSVVRRVGIGSLPNSIKVRRLLCGEHSADVWRVWSSTVPVPRRPGSCACKVESTADVALPSVLPGCRVRTAFRLRHCPACSAVPVEPLHVEVGRSPRVPCRPSVQWGLHRFACRRRVDTVSRCVDPAAVDCSGAAGDRLASPSLPLRWSLVCEALQDVPQWVV